MPFLTQKTGDFFYRLLLLFEKAQEKMKMIKMPEFLINRLKEGR